MARRSQFVARSGLALAAFFLLFSARELAIQRADRSFLIRTARAIVEDSRANDPPSRALSVRRYLRAHVAKTGRPLSGSPFLRASAAEVVRSGQGSCGEDTRAFIGLARELGIRARRVYLYGDGREHIVAQVSLPGRDREHLLLDCQADPEIGDFEPLERVMLKGDYREASYLNVHRLGLGWLFSDIRLAPAAANDWLESPALMRFFFWILAALASTVASVASLRTFSH